MSSLYRFISFETLVDTVQRKSLAFVKPETWDDPCEGYILQKLKKPGGIEEITKCINDKFGKQRLEHIEFIAQIGTNYYGQCWTKTVESDAFWRIYSYDSKSVRIEISTEDLHMLKCEGMKVIHGSVEYEDELSLEKELGKILVGDGINALNAFLTKRRAFSHENEYRLMTFAIGDASVPVKHVQFEDVSFIKSVTLHPLAPKWLNNTIQEYCKINKLKYNGQSNLYQFR